MTVAHMQHQLVLFFCPVVWSARGWSTYISSNCVCVCVRACAQAGALLWFKQTVHDIFGGFCSFLQIWVSTSVLALWGEEKMCKTSKIRQTEWLGEHLCVRACVRACVCVCVCVRPFVPRDYTDPFPGLSLLVTCPVSINSLVQEGQLLSRRSKKMRKKEKE